MPDRTREILEDLEAVRENLLALSDAIWLSIDHNDPEGLEEGVRFKRAYNEKMAAFDAGVRAFGHDPAVHQRPAGGAGGVRRGR